MKTWSRRRWATLVLALIGSLIGLGVLAAVLVPGLQSAIGQQQGDGSQAFDIGTIAQVTPAAGWSVQSAGADTLQLRSPDRELIIVLSPHTDELEQSAFDTLESESTPLRTEVLANGATLSHADSPQRILATLSIDATKLLIDVEVSAESQMSTYRTELAELLLRIEPQ